MTETQAETRDDCGADVWNPDGFHGPRGLLHNPWRARAALEVRRLVLACLGAEMTLTGFMAHIPYKRSESSYGEMTPVLGFMSSARVRAE